MYVNLLCLFLSFGFQTDDPIIHESLRIEYVLIDLIALDKDNQPVSDLRIQDFIVKDQGRKVSLETFQILDFSGRELTSDEFIPEQLGQNRVPSRQQFIFCLDLESLTLTQIKKTFSQLRRAIKETALPQNADYLLFSLNYGQQTPGFVTDRTKLLTHLALFENRIDDIRLRDHSANGYGDDESILEIPNPRKKRRTRPVGIDNPRGGVQRGSAILPQDYPGSDGYELEIEEEKLMGKLGLLESLASKFKETQGLKTIFFISPGFSLSPGKVAMQEKKHRARKAFANRTGANPLNSPPIEEMLDPRARSLHKVFEKVIHTCTRNRVVFHAMNVYLSAQETSVMLKGKPANIASRNDRAFFAKEKLRESHKGLEQLSKLSGGMVSRGADLQATLETWLPRLNYVYLLGYTSPSGKPANYRKIKIKCKRKKIKLHYRRGYVSAE